mmetsp:Transcript_19143/g.31368  ORF Transcript_19143/g.31368 Transcript_19143/m.31368 type:complete len:228 (-) Transcript_19143:113-796(-)
MNCSYRSLFVAMLLCALTTSSNAFCQLRSHATKVPQYCERYATATILLSKNDDKDEDFDKLIEDLRMNNDKNNFQGFLDSLLEIPDSQLLAGDLLFILVINFLLQIANEVSEPSFWLSGGFSQPITMPVTLLAVVVRDSKMSISWVLSALWNRGYSSSSVADDETAAKKTFQIWIDYCSIRILMELGLSLLITHSAVGGWLLFREVWYTALVMTFYRIFYSRYGMRF